MGEQGSYRAGLKLLKYAEEPLRQYAPDQTAEQTPPEYSQEVPLGRDKHTGEEIAYTPQDNDRIGVFGITGSGKTTLLKAFVSRLFLGGMKVVHASDIKNDFHDIDHKPGVSKQLIQDSAGLAPGEERIPISVGLYMPKLLANEYPGTVPYYLEQFTLGFQDISMADLKYLIPTNSTPQQVMLQNVLDAVGSAGLSFHCLREEIEMADDDRRNVKRALQTSLDSLENQQVLSTRLRKDPLANLDEQVVVLALENWDRFKRTGMEMVELYIAVTLRRLKEQLRDREIEGPVLVVMDEAHAFCPNGEDSISKREVVDLVDLGRAYKVPMLFASQHPSQLPHPDSTDRYDVVGSINHFFLAPNLPEPDWKQCLKASGMWRQYGNKDMWRERFASMEQYEWLYLNAETRSWRILQPYAPLCAHS